MNLKHNDSNLAHAMTGTESTGPLKAGGIGLLGATTLGVVMLSPAMTLYGGFGPAYLNAGAAAPLAYIWALLATLPTAVSYIILSKKYPTSGSAADWASLAFSKQVSVWSAWMVFLYYLTNFIIQPVTMGVFAGDLFQTMSISPGLMTFLIGALICLGWSATFVYRGISISSKGALTFLLIETAVVITLCSTVIYMAIHGRQSLTTEGFHLSASPDGSSGVFRAMVFGILAFCGFDVVSTLSEETRDPEKNIPRATVLALLFYAGIIIAGVWVLTYGGTREELQKIAEAGQMPITEIARRYWGLSGLLIPITGISASLGLAIATAVGASRVLYSMGRGGLAHRVFGSLEKNQSPIKALHLIFVLGLGASVLTAVFLGPYQAYVWWGTTSTFFALVTYMMVNASALVLYRKRWSEGISSLAIYFVVPVTGFLIDLYLLYRTFFVELWGQDWATGKSVMIFNLVCCFIALAVALKIRNPHKSSRP